MRIQNSSNITSTSKSRTKKAQSGGATFEVGQQAETNQAAPLSSGPDVASVDALLALQAVDSPLEGKKKTMARGHELLDQLEALKIDLLSGQISKPKLNRLLSLIQTQRERHGDGLDQLMDDIELRARVELAKYQQAKY